MVEVTFRAFNEFHQEIKRSTQVSLLLGSIAFLHELQDTLSLVTDCMCVRIMAAYRGKHIVIGHYFVHIDHVIPITAECFREYSVLRQKDGEFI